MFVAFPFQQHAKPLRHADLFKNSKRGNGVSRGNKAPNNIVGNGTSCRQQDIERNNIDKDTETTRLTENVKWFYRRTQVKVANVIRSFENKHRKEKVKYRWEKAQTHLKYKRIMAERQCDPYLQALPYKARANA